MQHNHFFAVVLIGLFVFVGCKNPDARYTKVEGVITYKGEPVEGASLMFIPVDSSGEAAAGFTDAKGKYTVTSVQSVGGGAGALPGEYVVTVSKREKAPPDPDQEAYDRNEIDYDTLQKRLAQRGDSFSSGPPSKSLIPVKYSQQGTSDLKATVEKGKVNKHNFELVD